MRHLRDESAHAQTRVDLELGHGPIEGIDISLGSGLPEVCHDSAQLFDRDDAGCGSPLRTVCRGGVRALLRSLRLWRFPSGHDIPRESLLYVGCHLQSKTSEDGLIRFFIVHSLALWLTLRT
jgi:hypothetical protein